MVTACPWPSYQRWDGMVFLADIINSSILPRMYISELHNRMPLYAVFEAARRLLVHIEQDAASLVNSLSSLLAILGSCKWYLNISSLLWVSSNNRQARECVNFWIIKRLMTGLKGKCFHVPHLDNWFQSTSDSLVVLEYPGGNGSGINSTCYQD